MRAIVTVLALLGVFAGVSTANAQEASRQAFLDLFTPLVGDWQITSPNGPNSDYTLAFSKNKACFIADTPKGTHMHCWNPSKKTISVMSCFSSGGLGLVDFRLEGERTLVGDVTIHNADGMTTTFKATWRIVSNDRQEFTADGQTSVFTRRK
jgi:hypothetical protein